MNSGFADEDDSSDTHTELDYSEIAALLAQVRGDGDAYDVLRDVLQMLNEHSRERRGPTH